MFNAALWELPRPGSVRSLKGQNQPIGFVDDGSYSCAETFSIKLLCAFVPLYNKGKVREEHNSNTEHCTEPRRVERPDLPPVTPVIILSRIPKIYSQSSSLVI